MKKLLGNIWGPENEKAERGINESENSSCCLEEAKAGTALLLSVRMTISRQGRVTSFALAQFLTQKIILHQVH